MLISKDLISQAKTTFGIKAAEIIAEELHIEKWDSKNLKGCCPFHKESTPSMVWNKKENYFKCFGCGKTYGILDYYIDSGLTFIESCRKLFDETGTYFDFSEYGLKTKKDYRYPKIETNTDRQKVEEYLALRCLSKETLDYAGIKQDKYGNIVFEYYDENNVLLLTKYRPSRKIKKGENKEWSQKEADTCPILYGMNQIDPTQPLIITEGEIDRLSCIEAGFKNTVSIPFGASSYGWIEYNWDWLEQFDKIIIYSDKDEPGEKMRQEVIPRLGEWRCYEAMGNEKDANLELYRHGKDAVAKIINNAKEVPIKDVIDLADVKDLDLDNLEKIKSNVKGLDKWIGGFYLGTVDIITGINGSGKSTFIDQVCICEPVEQGYKTFIFSGELNNQQLKAWIQYPMAGRRHIKEVDKGQFQPKGYVIKSEIKKQMEEWYRGKIFIYDNDLDYTSKSILNKMTELARKYGFKNFVLDNLMMIDLDCEHELIYSEQKNFVKELIKFASKFNAVVHLVAHPRKVETIRRLTKMDICGSGDIPNLAHYVVSIHRVTDHEKQGVQDKKGNWVVPPVNYDCLIDLFKNRIMGFQDKTIGVHFDIPSKRFYGDSDDIDRQYGWDETPYEEKEFHFTEIENNESPF